MAEETLNRSLRKNVFLVNYVKNNMLIVNILTLLSQYTVEPQ